MKSCPPAWRPPPIHSQSSSELLVTFVKTALENKLKGNASAYNKLVTSISTPLEGDAYTRWFSALCRCVSLISAERAHQQLLQAILSFHWDTTDDAIDAYRRLLTDLVCSSGRFLPMCFTGLVQKLRLHVTDDIESPFRVNSTELAAKIHDNIHLVLQSILNLIPTASTALFPVLADCYPHTRFAPSHHITYTCNMLRLVEYVPGLRDRIIELLGRKIVLIDNELIESDFPSAPAKPTHSPSCEDLILAEDSLLGVCVSDPSEIAADADRTWYATDALSLPHLIDQLMESVLEYLSSLRESPDVCQTVFYALLRVFESHMLTSRNCRHAPFLLFFVASFRNSFAETLLRYLLERAFDQFQNVYVRVACIQYLGAFLTRANFFRHATRMHSFEMLLRFVHAYVENHEEARLNEQASDPESVGSEHAVFYAVVETMFQLFCWFQRDFQTLIEESPQLTEFFRFTFIVESSLNPLRHCRGDVVAKFCTIVLALGLGDCYPVIRRNSMLSHAAPISSLQPFEPIRLLSTSRFFLDIYNESRDELYIERRCELQLRHN